MDTAKHYDNIPLSIKQLHQWVAQKQKRPINPRTGAGAKSNDPNTWATFDEAVEAVAKYNLDGIGVMFDNGLGGVDIDHCIENGVTSSLATDIIQLMNSYTEISPSGTGVHILFTGAIEKAADLYTKNPVNGVEMYNRERYFTVTGNTLGEPLPVSDRSEAAKQVQDKYMRKPKQEKVPAPASPTPASPTLSDEEIIVKAKVAANANDFIKLWSGDTSAHGGDDSAADLALCNILAFWSGRNADTIDRLFRQSGLFRSKWERKQSGTTYGAITVQKAIATCSNIYQPNNGAYVVENGCVYRKTGQNEKKYLANFSAYPLEDVEKDNGTEKNHYFTIGGKRSSGTPLPTVSISAEQFPALNWICKHWGMYPRVAPGNGNKDYFRDYIQSQAEGIPCKILYTHTGFRKINDKLCFLYHGGALGIDNIECELEGDLSRYTFLNLKTATERDALSEVLQLFHLAPPEISYPLLAFTYPMSAT